MAEYFRKLAKDGNAQPGSSALQNASTTSPTKSIVAAHLSVGTSTAFVGEAPITSASGVQAVSMNEVCETPVVPISGTKRFSSVWEYFKEYDKIEKVKDSNGEIVEVVQKRAYCKFCPRGKIGDFVVTGRGGTSGMLRHMNHSCRYSPCKVDKSQKVITGDRSSSKTTKLVAVGYNQADYMESCVEMVVIDELPFSFVEKKGFRTF